MAQIRIRILDFAAFMKLLFMVDEGSPGSARISDKVLGGDLTAAWASAKESADYIFSEAGFKDLMNTAVKYGIAKFVVEATPLKRSFTLFGMEIGF